MTNVLVCMYVYMQVDEEEDGRQEARLTAYLLSLLSFLVLLPGHPELGPFYIVRGLINAIPRFAWKARR